MSERPRLAADASLLSAAQLRQIIDGATDTAIISIDRAGFVATWSRGAQRIFGWTEEEMLGQKLDRLFTEQDRKHGQLAHEMTDALAHGRGGGEEGWRIRKDGSRMWAAGEMSPVRSEAGAVVGFTKVVRDRTAQRRAEDDRRARTALTSNSQSCGLGAGDRNRPCSPRSDRDGRRC